MEIAEKRAQYEEFEKTGNKDIFENIIDSMIMDGIAGMNESFRKAISSLPKDKKRLAILSILDKDRNLFAKIKESITDINLSKIDHVKNIILMLREYVKIAEVEKKKFGEVMTPLDLVKEMLNTLPAEVWSNPNLKWLDPANGTGPFPAVVIYKLMKGLESWEPDADKRYKHIIENMIYVCELQPKNMFLYLCTVDPKDELSCNIYTGSFLEEGFDYHMKNVWGVENFDIVIGNPPYQQMDGGNGASAKPIYNIFTEKSIKLSNIIIFVTPSRWFSGGKGLDNFRKMMMESNKIELINHFDDASKIFGNTVEIKGGVSYFLFNNRYNGDCNINSVGVKLSKFDIIIKDINKIKILDKINIDNNLSLITDTRSYFGIPTNFKEVEDTKINENYVKCYFSKQKGFDKWIDKKNISKNNTNWRVCTPRAAGSTGNLNKFGNLFIIEPNEYLSDSYISFRVNNIEEANSLISYLKTNFTQLLLSLRKIDHTIKPDTLKWIPIVPFDREWTDELLFQYFNLTDEEQDLIIGKDRIYIIDTVSKKILKSYWYEINGSDIRLIFSNKCKKSCECKEFLEKIKLKIINSKIIMEESDLVIEKGNKYYYITNNKVKLSDDNKYWIGGQGTSHSDVGLDKVYYDLLLTETINRTDIRDFKIIKICN